MAQSDDSLLLKALYELPNSRQIIANDLKDMAVFRDPYDHFVSVPEDIRCMWGKAAEILITIENQSVNKEQVKSMVGELRMMAEGIDRYSILKGASKWTRNIWYAAAEILENELQRTLH